MPKILKVLRGKKALRRKAYKTVFRGFTKNLFSGIHRFRRTVNSAGETGLTVANALSVVAPYSHVLFTAAAAANVVSYGQLSYYSSLTNIPNVTEFTNLFDQYKIDKVTHKIMPYSTMSVGNNAAGTTAPAVIVHWVLDHDEATIPVSGETGIAELEQYPGYRKKNINSTPNGITISYRPRAAQAVYQGAFTAYAEVPKNTWMNCSNSTIQYYGLKMVIEGLQGAVASYTGFRFETTYDISFKGVR